MVKAPAVKVSKVCVTCERSNIKRILYPLVICQVMPVIESIRLGKVRRIFSYLCGHYLFIFMLVRDKILEVKAKSFLKNAYIRCKKLKILDDSSITKYLTQELKEFVGNHHWDKAYQFFCEYLEQKKRVAFYN